MKYLFNYIKSDLSKEQIRAVSHHLIMASTFNNLESFLCYVESQPFAKYGIIGKLFIDTGSKNPTITFSQNEHIFFKFLFIEKTNGLIELLHTDVSREFIFLSTTKDNFNEYHDLNAFVKFYVNTVTNIFKVRRGYDQEVSLNCYKDFFMALNQYIELPQKI